MAIVITSIGVVAGLIAIVTGFIVCVKFGARVLFNLEKNTNATVQNTEATKVIGDKFEQHVTSSNQIHLDMAKALAYLEGRSQ